MNIDKVYPTAPYCNDSIYQIPPNAIKLSNIELQFVLKEKYCLGWVDVGIISKNYQNTGIFLTLNNGNIFNITPKNINQLIRTLKSICNFNECKYKMILKHTNVKRKKIYIFDNLYQTIHWCLEIISDCKHVNIIS